MITKDEYYLEERDNTWVVRCSRDNYVCIYYEGTYDECKQWIDSQPEPDMCH